MVADEMPVLVPRFKAVWYAIWTNSFPLIAPPKSTTKDLFCRFEAPKDDVDDEDGLCVELEVPSLSPSNVLIWPSFPC